MNHSPDAPADPHSAASLLHGDTPPQGQEPPRPKSHDPHDPSCQRVSGAQATHLSPDSNSEPPSSKEASSLPPLADDSPSLAIPTVPTGTNGVVQPQVPSSIAGALPSHNASFSEEQSQSQSLHNSSSSLAATPSQQLIYLRIKHAAYSSDRSSFKDSLTLHQDLLEQLSQIPILKQTGVFNPQDLRFALAKHVNHSSRNVKGFFFTAAFTLSSKHHSVLLPELILQAQALQEKSVFIFDLPASSKEGKEGAKESSMKIKAKVTFALDIAALMDNFSLEFQVKIPLVTSNNPDYDFALLLSEILFPPDADAPFTSAQRDAIMAERRRFQSYCKPLKNTTTNAGVIASKLMLGAIPLNLDDTMGRDAAICERVVFAALYGLDMRTRHHQKYVLLIPILSDQAQLDRAPPFFKDTVKTLKQAFAASGIQPLHRKRRGSNSSSSATESESDELFSSRLAERTKALAKLSYVELSNPEDIEYPNLALFHRLILPQNNSASNDDSNGSEHAAALHSKEALLCPDFQQGRCKLGNSCKLKHVILLLPSSQKDPQTHAQDEIQSSLQEDAQPNVHDKILLPLPQLSPREEFEHLCAEAEYEIALSRRSQDLYKPQHPYDASMSANELLHSFPTLEQCAQASRERVAGDGDCLWTAFYKASKHFIQFKPSFSPLDLRTTVMKFITMNKTNFILPLPLIPDCPISLSSPLASLRSQMTKMFVLNQNDIMEPCKCLSIPHTCKGLRHDVIIRQGHRPTPYFSFEHYVQLMSLQGSYSEDLEIMALAALYRVNIGVWNPARSNLSASITAFHQLNPKGLVMLVNSDGQSHYDYLIFERNPILLHEKETQSISLASHSIPFDQALVQLLQLRVEQILLQIATSSKYKFQFGWPSSSIPTPTHRRTAETIDSLLFVPCKSNHTHSCCQSNGNCDCCNSTACDWGTSDPWSHPSHPLLAFSKLADSILTLASMDHSLFSSSVSISVGSCYLFSRTFTALQSFSALFSKLSDTAVDDLTLAREICKKIAGSVNILRPRAQKLNQDYLQSFNLQSALVQEISTCAVDILDLAIAISYSTANIEDSQESISSSQEIIIVQQKSQLEDIARDLALKAEKAAKLCAERIDSVTEANFLIARLQIERLITDIPEYLRFCTTHKQNLIELAQPHDCFDECSLRILKAIDSIKVSSTAKQLTQAHWASKQILNPKSPAKRLASKPATTAPSPRQTAQQNMMASFFARISSTAKGLPAFDSALRQTDNEEQIIRSLELNADPDDVAHDRLLHNRAKAQSSASRFLPEATNAQSKDAPDSFDSGNSQNEDSADREFAHNSQGSDMPYHLHPRFAQARAHINIAAQNELTPEVLSVTRVTNVPRGFCPKGHSINVRPSLKRGKTVICSVCTAPSADVFSCPCLSTPFYICAKCLSEHRASSAPPACPRIDCLGSCLVKYKPLSQLCHHGNHAVPPREEVWMCSVKDCRSIICFECLANKNKTPTNSTAPVSASQSASVRSCPPTSFSTNPNGPSGEPESEA
jgi:hypothetical protein